MAQAVTFRAFGAENPGFDTTCVARVISIQSRFAEVEKTFAAKPPAPMRRGWERVDFELESGGVRTYFFSGNSITST